MAVKIDENEVSRSAGFCIDALMFFTFTSKIRFVAPRNGIEGLIC